MDSDAAAIQADLDFILTSAALISIGYDGDVSSHVQDHAVRGELDGKL